MMEVTCPNSNDAKRGMIHMKFIGFSVKEAISAIYANKRSSRIIFLTISVTLASILVLLQSFLYSSSFLESINKNQRTYHLNMSPWGVNHEAGSEFVRTILYGNYPFQIEEVRGIATYTELYELYPASYVSFYAEIILDDLPNAYLEKKEIQVTHGRTFLQEELITNKQVVIIDEGGSMYDNQEINEMISIMDEEYQIIGLTSSGNFIPFISVMDNEDFLFVVDQIVFAYKLSSAERSQFYKEINNLGGTPVSVYEMHMNHFVLTIVLYLIIIVIVMFCCMGTVVALFHYMVKSRMYDFNVFKLCGIGRGQLLSLFYTPLFMIFILSCLAGFVLYRMSIPLQGRLGITGNLPWQIILLAFLLLLFFMLITVEPLKRRLIKAPPINKLLGESL